MPSSLPLFELVRGAYVLRFMDAMSGKVGGLDGVATLDELRATDARGRRTAAGKSRSTAARGKIVIGDTTFLFQFIALPPVVSKPRLPTAVRTGVFDGIDWLFTTCVAISFMVQFGVLAYLENADRSFRTTSRSRRRLRDSSLRSRRSPT